MSDLQPDRLREAFQLMDRLRSPGGCPWDAAQTHESLVRYLVEECYELVQAIEDADPVAIREELGDVLLQVLFHARIGEEAAEPAARFTLDDVAEGLIDKLVRRHPAVFGNDEQVSDAADQQRRWDELKQVETGRGDALSGVSMAAPALALSAKLGARATLHRLSVHGLAGDATTRDTANGGAADGSIGDGDTLAEQIFRLAFQAGRDGRDIESEVRAVARRYADGMRTATN